MQSKVGYYGAATSPILFAPVQIKVLFFSSDKFSVRELIDLGAETSLIFQKAAN